MTLISRIKDKIFYGWIIVIASLIVIAVLIGIRFSFGVFFKSIQGELDLTRAVTSSVFSVHMLLAAAFAVIGGWAFDRYGPRSIVLLMGLIAGASLLITSQANSLWQLYLSYSLLLAIGTGGIIPVVTATVSKWFDKRRGLAIGLTTSGPGLGTLVMAPLAASLITNFGWRMSYIVLGLVAPLIVVPISTLLRRAPKEIDLLPDGISSSSKTADSSERTAMAQPMGLSLRQALGTRNLWLIWSIFALQTFCLTLILTHVVPYATDMGISITEASTILSVNSGSCFLFRILVGRISDTVGRKVPGIICAIIGAGGLLWLTGAQDLWMFYVFAIVFGLSWGAIGTIYLTLVSEIFGVRSLGVILGILEVGVSVGSAIGPAIGGFIFDLTGSYIMAFSIAAGAMLTIALLAALIRSEKDTRVS